MQEKMFQASLIKNIEIDIEHGNLNIVPTDGETLVVQFTGNQTNHTLNTMHINDVLTIQVETTKMKIMNFYPFSRKTETTIFLPLQPYNKILVNSDHGNISVHRVRCEKLDLNSDFGNVALREVNGTNIGIATDNGNLLLNQIVAERFTAETDNGNIRVEYIRGSLFADSGNGNIHIIKETLDEPLHLTTDNGNIHVITKNKPDQSLIDIQTGHGHVNYFGEKLPPPVLQKAINIIKVHSNNGNITFVSETKS